ncbi:MAG: hypothetical protein P8O97_03755 [Gammaproteobacteria bacterium]|nr:hypothetical protein [Gammaproteobacteria bacterium]
MTHWKYQLTESYHYKHKALTAVDFDSDWLIIKNGLLTLNKGYTWDGCSPTFILFGLITLGTPDGVLRYGKPWTYHASLVHDALLQYRASLPLSKHEITGIFNDQLKEVRWPLRWLYVKAVSVFGPQDFIK